MTWFMFWDIIVKIGYGALLLAGAIVFVVILFHLLVHWLHWIIDNKR